MSEGFIERLARGPLLADGAMGTLLYARGMPYDRSFDALCLSDPDLVRGVHMDYVAAGAEMIETNTFGANAIRLAEHGLADQVAAINAAGAELAVRVAAAAEHKVFVAGSVGPLGATLAPVGAIPLARAKQAYRDQIAALAAGGVDVIYLETMPDLTEALLALAAAREACDLPVVVSLTYREEGLTGTETTPEEAAVALEAAGADAIGANCSTGPAPLLDVSARLVSATSLPVSVMPNAGLPAYASGRYIYTSSPSYMAGVARQMLGVGVRVIGGCCGTAPEHIAAMDSALRAGGERVPALSFPSPSPSHTALAVQEERPTRLQRALESHFTVTVEVDPPNGFDIGSLLPPLRALRDTGLVDAFDVADSPRAQARMSALAMASLLQRELGVDTVLHLACRHRNLVAVHSEILGAHALGIRNVFVVMGDLPALGDYPDATAVRDITATGLMSLLARFNQGVDAQGRPLDGATAFHIGCAFAFQAPDLGRELDLLEKKIAAGAQFALSQPVYDPELVVATLDRMGGSFPMPLLVGVLPLWNARHANFLHNEVPGIEIPDDVRERMIRAGDAGPREGVLLAREVLTELSGQVRGAYFMPPFGRYELVSEVCSGLVAKNGDGGAAAARIMEGAVR